MQANTRANYYVILSLRLDSDTKDNLALWHQVFEMAEKALSIYEILERVLINTDRRTLLLSQRVCRTWNAHINKSHNLQEALFFKPVRYELPYGSRRIRNPFIKEQPLTDYVGFINHSVSNVDHCFDRFFKSDGDCLRIGDIAVGPERGSLVPQQGFPCVFWLGQRYPVRRIELVKPSPKEMRALTSAYLKDCEFVIVKEWPVSFDPVLVLNRFHEPNSVVIDCAFMSQPKVIEERED